MLHIIIHYNMRKKIYVTALILTITSCTHNITEKSPKSDSTVVAIDTLVTENNTNTITDFDGNVYKTLTIGKQVWIVENLKVKHFNNGDPISWVTDPNIWDNQSNTAYCGYKNDVDSIKKYGCLYNRLVVSDNRNIAPEGWKIPDENDWDILIKYLIAKGYNYDNSKSENKLAKSIASKNGWMENETLGNIGCNLTKNNKSGFNAIPSGSYGGGYYQTGIFLDNIGVGSCCGFWEKQEANANDMNYVGLSDNQIDLGKGIMDKKSALSIRCIKDPNYIKTSKNSNVNTSDNSWLIGTWEVLTDVGIMNLTILDSRNATFLGDRGTFRVQNGVLKWKDLHDIITPFTLNYTNKTINSDSFVLRKHS